MLFVLLDLTVNTSTLRHELALDVAIPFWSLLLPDRFPRLEMWCDFVQNKYGRSISKDTWYLVRNCQDSQGQLGSTKNGHQDRKC